MVPFTGTLQISWLYLVVAIFVVAVDGVYVAVVVLLRFLSKKKKKHYTERLRFLIAGVVDFFILYFLLQMDLKA